MAHEWQSISDKNARLQPPPPFLVALALLACISLFPSTPSCFIYIDVQKGSLRFLRPQLRALRSIDAAKKVVRPTCIVTPFHAVFFFVGDEMHTKTLAYSSFSPSFPLLVSTPIHSPPSFQTLPFIDAYSPNFIHPIHSVCLFAHTSPLEYGEDGFGKKK